MVDRFHLGPGTLALAQALKLDVPEYQGNSLALDPPAYYQLFASYDGEAEYVYREFSELLGLSTLDPVFLIAVCNENMAGAAHSLAQYKTLIGPLRLDASDDDQGFKLRLTWPMPEIVPPLAYAIETLFWLVLARKGAREPQAALSLTMPVMPAALQAFEEVAGVKVVKGNKHEILFSSEAVRVPFVNRRADLVALFEDNLSTTLEPDFMSLLREELTVALPSGRATISEIARRLGLSARSLQRRLFEMDTSFRQVLDSTRAKLDAQLAEMGSASAAEIAFLLGFQSVNSLYRARKEWHGEAGCRHVDRSATARVKSLKGKHFVPYAGSKPRQ